MPDAYTWTRQHETELVQLTAPHSYDVATGTYIATRIFDVNAESEIACTGTDNPGNFNITHTDATTVVMVPVVFQAQRRKVDLSRVTVTYEGHVIGIVSVEGEHSTGSEKIQFDLVTHKGIGPKNAGTNRRVPQTAIKVVENYYNASAAETVVYLYKFRCMTGFVNEDGWTPVCLHTKFYRGEWLYDGNTHTKNRDGSYTITHRFVSDVIKSSTAERGMHQYQWYDIKVADGKIEEDTSTQTLSQIQYVAGTDVATKFSDAFSAFGYE